MAKSPDQVPFGAAHEGRAARYEIVFEGSLARKTPSGLLEELKVLGGRAGSSFVHAYARLASAVLGRVEAFEDLNAARRRGKSDPKRTRAH